MRRAMRPRNPQRPLYQPNKRYESRVGRKLRDCGLEAAPPSPRRPQGRHHLRRNSVPSGAPRLRALARCRDIGPSPARRACVAAIPRQSRARLLAEAPGACCYRNALPSLRKRASGRERPPTCMICFLSAPRPAAVDGASALCRAAARRSAHPKDSGRRRRRRESALMPQSSRRWRLRMRPGAA
jgi:hypothetical protein